MITTENKTPGAKGFVPNLLPWLLGAGMFVVYLVTLNHWVTPNGLAALSDVSGWNAVPRISGPLTYIITFPLRWLPPSILPLALNLFSALFGALALVLLARSVALLPHDRTHEQREREESEFSILTIATAWIPPLFAVLVCGLQMSFWENATQATFETFNLFLFAYVIRCLLEYRLEPKESWLTRFALVCGLGMANNWAMIGFYPLLLVALIWIKGLSSLNPPFLIRILLLTAAGFCLFFLMPIVSAFSHAHLGFWGTIRSDLVLYKRIFFSFPRETIGVLALTSLLPVFVIGIRWASYFGDQSPLGIFLATSIFHIVHAVLLGACLWVALDSPLSPRQIGFGLPFLTFYYLGALSIGYFAGYFLLIFGTRIPKTNSAYYSLLRVINLLVIIALVVILIGAPGLLVRKNLPTLKDDKTIAGIFQNYFSQVEKLLPQPGAVVLSDDALRLLYLESTLQRDGKSADYLLIDSQELGNDPHYLSALRKRSRKFELPASWDKTNELPTAVQEINFLERLENQHRLYYLDPSFGFYFEHFYLEPHGLVYEMKHFTNAAWDVPPLAPQKITENRAFWQTASNEYLPPLLSLLSRPAFSAHLGKWEQFLSSLHLKTEPPSLAIPAGSYYSRAINYWGVTLEKSGQTNEAAACFDQAVELNLANLSARINRFFNKNRAAKKPVVRLTPKMIEDILNQQNGWASVLNNDGPCDDPNFCSELSNVLLRGQNFRQAVQQLDTVRKFMPNDLLVRLQLARLQIYIQTYTNSLSQFIPYTNCYAEALANTDFILNQMPREPDALFLKGIALIQLKDYQRAIEPLSDLLSQTNNYAARLNRAIAYFKLGNFAAAKPDYQAITNTGPDMFKVYYGLAEIAYHDKDVPTAIKNFRLYLTNAPPQAAEIQEVQARLKELKADGS